MKKQLLSSTTKTVLFACASLYGVTPNATGFFKVNTAAELKLKPLTFVSGKVTDTTYTFSVKAGDSIAFSLPVEGKSVGIESISNASTTQPRISITQQRLIVDAGGSMANGEISIATLSGREVAAYQADQNGQISADLSQISQGIYILRGKSTRTSFATKMNLDGTSVSLNSASVTGSNHVRTLIARAGTTATYRLDVKSNNSAFSDLSNQTVTLQSGANGTKIITLAAAGSNDVVANFKSLLDSATYDKLFPNRYGLGREEDSWNPGSVTKSDGLFDFYTYRSLMAAISALSEVRVEIWNREGDTSKYASKIKWFNKASGKTMEFITEPDYFAEWNLDKKEIKSGDVDFAKFCAEGNLFTRKRELAAFLANISHETTGMGSEEPKKNWGLYWREEVIWQQGSKTLGYIDPNSRTYPPYPGKSYHGRGPIQISYNTNYGQVSEFLFGDKNVLLKQPELILTTDSDKDGVEDAMLAFQSGIWFWMYPQGAKPSCHDIMVGNWKPTEKDIIDKRDKSQFGMTINVINGGQECGKGDKLESPLDRIGFYRKYCNFMNVPVPEDEYCNCGIMEYLQ